MILAYIGDLIITQTSHQSLDPHDPIPFHNIVHFRDVPTGRTAEIHCDSEVEAINMVAAWLMADETLIATKLEKALAKLDHELPRDKDGRHIFLP